MTVTVAADELTAEADLALYARDAPTEADAATGVYRLTGAPRHARLTVTMSAAADGIGERFLLVLADTALAVFPATIGGGVLTAVVEGSGATQTGDAPLEFMGVDALTDDLVGEPPHQFHVRVPPHRRAAVDSIIPVLAGVHAGLSDAGFPLTGPAECASDEVSLGTLDLEVTPAGELIPNAPGVHPGLACNHLRNDPCGHGGYLLFDRASLDPVRLDATRGDAAAGLGRLRAGLLVSGEQDPQNRAGWLVQAIGLWAAGRWGGEAIPAPAPSKAEIRATIAGLAQAADPFQEPSAGDLAHGMAGFLGWAAAPERWGPGLVRDLAAASDPDHRTPANLVAAFGDVQPRIWWHQYVRDLGAGDVVPVSDLAFVSPADGIFVINDPVDDEWTFTAEYPVLSARAFSVRIDTDDLDPSAAAHFSLSGHAMVPADVQVHLFKRRDGVLTHLESGSLVMVAGLSELRREGYHLVAIVSNSTHEEPYDRQLTVDLEMVVVDDQDDDAR